MNTFFPTTGEIEELMRAIAQVRIGVLGDFCLDAYFEIDSRVEEFSIETGKRIQHVRRQRYSPGGAGNVVMNLHALRPGAIEIFGIVGDDLFGREMVRQFNDLGVRTHGLISQSTEWDTAVYGKPLLDGEEQQRLDFGPWNTLSHVSWERLQQDITNAREHLDFLIVNQQLPLGWCNEERAEWMRNELCTKWDGRHLVDARHFVRAFRGAALKLNQQEASSLFGQQVDPTHNTDLSDDEAQTLASELGHLSTNPQFMTRGEHGLIAIQCSDLSVIPGAQITGPIDSVGAGDTVTAMLAACEAAGVAPARAAVMANLAASISVQKLKQTGTANESELIRAAHQLAYVYHPTLADEVRQATLLGTSEIEVVDRNALANTARSMNFNVAVFDHDGTISTLRQGWENVMEPVMVRSILGEKYRTAESNLYQQVLQRVRDYIEQSTGIQTIAQMDALVQLVDEFGIVPPQQRLDAWGYKAVYNQALMQMVGDRLARLERGELDATDFTMKSVVPFLRVLHDRGILLYLVSGTDEADTIHEAEVLGYAGLFEGRILGAKPGSRMDAKNQVLSDILQSMSSGKRFVVFGDGPVEVRLARRYGGLAVGVASNEERRFGLNPIKRRRLIRAGAHYITPDFTQWQYLVALLTGQNQT